MCACSRRRVIINVRCMKVRLSIQYQFFFGNRLSGLHLDRQYVHPRQFKALENGLRLLASSRGDVWTPLGGLYITPCSPTQV